jgi:hypothetical protein
MHHPAIVVVTYNRQNSLMRLLGSLSKARYPEGVPLVISIDGGDHREKEIVKIAEKFRWPHGKKEVICHEKNMGLRRHILCCGDLTQRYDSVIVLEDDTYVSPVFYLYAMQTVRFYGPRPEIGGISLYAPRLNPTTHLIFEPLSDGADVYFIQWASSWGQIWTYRQWLEFRQWYARNDGPITDDACIPDDAVQWPESSWKKYYVKYLVETDRFFVYPRESLSTSFQEAGLHMDNASIALQTALQCIKETYRLQHLENSCCVYDAWHNLLPDRLNKFVPELKEYEYVVDLSGHRPLKKIKAPYLLTCRPASNPILQFGKKMRPIEMNVIEMLPGQGISLCHKDDAQARIEIIKVNGPCLYSELQITFLFPLMLKRICAGVKRRYYRYVRHHRNS